VVGQEGSTFLRALEAAELSGVQTYPSNDAGFEALRSGEIDAYVTGVQSRYQTDVTKTWPTCESPLPLSNQPLPGILSWFAVPVVSHIGGVLAFRTPFLAGTVTLACVLGTA